jgi:hypothetical protein
MHWRRIVKAATSKNNHFAQKEDVVNWITSWISHDLDWVNPVWSVQSTRCEPEFARVYYVE